MFRAWPDLGPQLGALGYDDGSPLRVPMRVQVLGFGGGGTCRLLNLRLKVQGLVFWGWSLGFGLCRLDPRTRTRWLWSSGFAWSVWLGVVEGIWGPRKVLGRLSSDQGLGFALSFFCA